MPMFCSRGIGWSFLLIGWKRIETGAAFVRIAVHPAVSFPYRE
jgi:hypothetical protein